MVQPRALASRENTSTPHEQEARTATVKVELPSVARSGRWSATRAQMQTGDTQQATGCSKLPCATWACSTRTRRPGKPLSPVAPAREYLVSRGRPLRLGLT